jgi:hypothetical protein
MFLCAWQVTIFRSQENGGTSVQCSRPESRRAIRGRDGGRLWGRAGGVNPLSTDAMPQDTCIIEFTTAAARRRRSQCQADRRGVWTKPKAFATAAWRRPNRPACPFERNISSPIPPGSKPWVQARRAGGSLGNNHRGDPYQRLVVTGQPDCGTLGGNLCTSSGHSCSTSFRISSETSERPSVSRRNLCSLSKSSCTMMWSEITRGA